MTKLTQRVYRALDALLIERMRDSVSKSMKSLPELLKRFDTNGDGFLEHHELESLFLDCQLAFKPQIFNRICLHIMDLNQGSKKQTKISC